MRSETESIYKILPFDNLIKFNIYTQHYKNHICPFKQELMEYPLFTDAKRVYFDNKPENESIRDCMYRLFKDMAFHMYRNISRYNESLDSNSNESNVSDSNSNDQFNESNELDSNELDSSLIEPVAFQVYVELMNADYLRSTPESLEIRARKLWKNMTTEQKKGFMSS